MSGTLCLQHFCAIIFSKSFLSFDFEVERFVFHKSIINCLLFLLVQPGKSLGSVGN